MEWKVSNALSRDVERQQLNKILKDIRQSIAVLQVSTTSVVNTTNIITGTNSNYNPSTGETTVTPAAYTLILEGDVSGSVLVTGKAPATITTILDPSLIGVEEAPSDNQSYWRRNGEWSAVPDAILAVADIQDEGLVAIVQDPDTYSYVWTAREILGTANQIDVTSGSAIAGNPVIALADLADTGVGDSTVKLLTRDAKGRIEGTEDASTDNLPEGASNLYYTDERAQDSVGNILQDTADIGIVYDDITPSITANIINPVLTNISTLSPTDGDIMEYNGTDLVWSATKAPRSLYLDGGNF